MNNIKQLGVLKKRLEQPFAYTFLNTIILNFLKRKGLLNHGWHDRREDEKIIINACAFTQTVLPFSMPIFNRRDAKLSDVDPQKVFGGHYKQYNAVSMELANDLIEKLDQHTLRKSHEAAHYVKIGNTDVYVAIEGKNRIDLYKQNNRPIKALVSKTDYPAPEELKMHIIKPHNSFCIEYIGADQYTRNNLQPWQVININARYYAGLPYEESVHFFEDYGVTWGKELFSLKGWLANQKIKTYITHRFYRS